MDGLKLDYRCRLVGNSPVFRGVETPGEVRPELLVRPLELHFFVPDLFIFMLPHLLSSSVSYFILAVPMPKGFR